MRGHQFPRSANLRKSRLILGFTHTILWRFFLGGTPGVDCQNGCQARCLTCGILNKLALQANLVGRRSKLIVQ